MADEGVGFGSVMNELGKKQRRSDDRKRSDKQDKYHETVRQTAKIRAFRDAPRQDVVQGCCKANQQRTSQFRQPI